MNRKMLFIVGAVAIVTIGLFLVQTRANQPAQDPAAPQRTITAYGTGTVTGKPDSVRIYFEVITNGKTVAAAREENARTAAKVQAALLALKLPDLKAKTRESHVSIEYDEKVKNRIVGYVVQQTFTVLAKEPDSEKLGVIAARLLDVGIEHGVNSGGKVEFFKDDDTEMQRQAHTKAVEDGIANAKAYAAGAKVGNLGVVEISNHNGGWGCGFGGGIQGGFNGGLGAVGGVPGGGATPSAFVAGDWKVSSQVRVVMKY